MAATNLSAPRALARCNSTNEFRLPTRTGAPVHPRMMATSSILRPSTRRATVNLVAPTASAAQIPAARSQRNLGAKCGMNAPTRVENSVRARPIQASVALSSTSCVSMAAGMQSYDGGAGWGPNGRMPSTLRGLTSLRTASRLASPLRTRRVGKCGDNPASSTLCTATAACANEEDTTK